MNSSSMGLLFKIVMTTEATKMIPTCIKIYIDVIWWCICLLFFSSMSYSISVTGHIFYDKIISCGINYVNIVLWELYDILCKCAHLCECVTNLFWCCLLHIAVIWAPWAQSFCPWSRLDGIQFEAHRCNEPRLSERRLMEKIHIKTSSFS